MFQQRHLAVCCISPLCNVVIFYRNVNQSIKVAISVAFVSLYVRLSVRPSRSQRITGEPEGLACPNAESRFLALDATRVTSFKVKRSKGQRSKVKVTRPTIRSIHQSIDQSVLSIKQSINQSIHPTSHQSINQPINRPPPLIETYHEGAMCPPYNQSINQSIRKIFNVSRITNVIARSTEYHIIGPR